ALNSGVSDSAQRMADQAEYVNILGSMDRIVTQTRFGGQALLAWNDVNNTNTVQFQVGEQSGDSVTLTVSAMQAINLQFGAVAGVSTAGNALATLGVISNAITAVTNTRGVLGAFQANTLETGLRSLAVTHENLTAAESVIRDVDFAEESAVFTKNQILVQSATAMLAQANQLPQSVLKLLG
ncbi:MAG TPA: flagellin, partial [Planctomycetota bacterium]|nr:flagellin [Planctomycetota bacterium]